VLAASVFHAGICLVRSGRLWTNAFYVVMVPLLALALSTTVWVIDRFTYLGFGTWCTLAFLAVGWSACKGRRLALVLGSGILALYAFSLIVYYQNLHLKYPGPQLVIRYLERHPDRWDKAIVSTRLALERIPPLPSALPGNIEVSLVGSVEDIPRELLGKTQAVGFLQGDSQSVASELSMVKAKHPGFSYVLEESWISLVTRGASIHVYRLGLSEE
jgi:hypothetical protein